MPQPADRIERLLQRERETAFAVRAYFVSQSITIADAVLDVGDVPSPDNVGLIFNEQAAHTQLIEVVKPELVQTALTLGVGNAVEDLPSWQVVDDAVGIISPSFDLPANLRAAVNNAIDEVVQQPYWQDIQAESSVIIADVIRDGMRQGDNAATIARRIRDEFAENGKVRAERIARTEVAAARNAGTLESAKAAARDGLVIRKVWSSTLDNSLRPTHRDADGQSVAQAEYFYVGSWPCNYPAEFTLPVGERINCRCGMYLREV